MAAGAVFALAAACGARLISLSAALHADRARAVAQRTAASYAQALQAEMQALVVRARDAATRGAGRDVFSLTADGHRARGARCRCGDRSSRCRRDAVGRIASADAGG